MPETEHDSFGESRREGESDSDFIARLEREAARCFAAAASGKEWPHHAKDERRTGLELLAQANALRALNSTGAA